MPFYDSINNGFLTQSYGAGFAQNPKDFPSNKIPKTGTLFLTKYSLLQNYENCL